MLVMMHFVTACESLNNGEISKGADLCTIGIKTFTFNDDELGKMSRANLENANQVNCELYLKCGFHIPSTKLCNTKKAS